MLKLRHLFRNDDLEGLPLEDALLRGWSGSWSGDPPGSPRPWGVDGQPGRGADADQPVIRNPVLLTKPRAVGIVVGAGSRKRTGRGVRVVEGGGLENRWAASRSRGFESLPLRTGRSRDSETRWNLERCESGRIGRPAKALYLVTGTEGSNPSLSVACAHSSAWIEH